MQLEIWSDIACPWCYVGKRRLESALAEFDGADEVEITWRSFELDPDAPPERHGDLAEGLARKYGITPEQARASQASLSATAAAEGLTFRFDQARSGNTFDGHRLVHLAAEHGVAGEVKEWLLDAYFSRGRLISDAETLREAAEAAGLPEVEVEELLSGERFAEEVRADEQAARELGIGGVPTFIVDRKVGVTGAQPSELLLEMLRRAQAPA
jgi:predicted DsbA family dithiol-disulfide isomerase